MNSDFWINRWKTDDTPWQQNEPDPLLVQYFESHSAKNIFIPLCGKSLDMPWFVERGHHVYGVELSSLACHSFFKETNLKYTSETKGSFELFKSEKIEIWCGDFFALSQNHLPKLDLIYDRAALIALPSDMRKQYVRHITALAKSNGSKDFQILLLLRTQDPATSKGPPFHVSSEEVAALYGSDFDIQFLGSLNRKSKTSASVSVKDSAYKLLLK